jgi:hypothetical protein
LSGLYSRIFIGDLTILQSYALRCARIEQEIHHVERGSVPWCA